MSPRTYQDIELGKTERLEADALARLAEMGVDLAALVSREIGDLRVSDNIAAPTPDHGLTAAKIRATELARAGGDPLGMLPPELSEGELLILEFGAWVRRKLIASPETINDLSPAMRRLMNEVENGRLAALKMDVVAHPEAWGDNLRELVKALPAFERRRLLDWLADQTSDGAERKPDPGRTSAAVGGGKK